MGTDWGHLASLRCVPRSSPPWGRAPWLLSPAWVPMAVLSFPQGGSAESAAQACRIHALFLILHSGNILDQGAGEPGSKQADVQTLAATFDAVTRVHFPEALGHVALRLVPCPPICAAAYALVSKYGWQHCVPCHGARRGLSSWKSTPGLQEGTGEVVASEGTFLLPVWHQGDGMGWDGKGIAPGAASWGKQVA